MTPVAAGGPIRRLGLVLAVATLIVGLVGCAAPAPAPAGDQPAAAESDPAASGPCATAPAGDFHEVALSEMPDPGGVALPTPDCLLMGEVDPDFPLVSYEAFYLDPPDDFWSKVESDLLAGGFEVAYELVDGVEQIREHYWNKSVDVPGEESMSAQLSVNQVGDTWQTRDGEAIDVAIAVLVE
jgi:hypothetical protein